MVNHGKEANPGAILLVVIPWLNHGKRTMVVEPWYHHGRTTVQPLSNHDIMVGISWNFYAGELRQVTGHELIYLYAL